MSVPLNRAARYTRVVRALLVDLDDTLLDYTGDVELSWTQACASCALDGTVSPDRLIAAIAECRRWFWIDPERSRRERLDMPGAWRKIVVHALGVLGVDDAALATRIAQDYARRRRERMRLFPEALDALQRWRRAGIGLGLVTNGDAAQQRDKIERHDLARFFDVIVIEGEFGAGKPEESVYRHALAALSATPHESSMVGDNLEWDVIAPQRLGLSGVWIDRAGAGLPDDFPGKPHRIIRTLSELRVP